MKKTAMFLLMSFLLFGCAVEKNFNRSLKQNLNKHGIYAGDESTLTGERFPSQSFSREGIVACESIKQDQGFLYSTNRDRRMRGNMDFKRGRIEKEYCFIEGATIKKDD